MELPAGRLIDIASGVFLLLLGAWLTTLRPRHGATLAFGVAAGCWGIGRVLGNLGEAYDISALVAAGNIFLLLSALAILLLVGRLVPGSWRLLATAVAAVVVCTALAAYAVGERLGEGSPPLHRASLYVATLLLALVVARDPSRSGSAPQPLPLMGAALLLDPSLRLGIELLAGASGRTGLAWIPAHLLVLVAWLAAAARLPAPAARHARDAALVVAAVPLLGMLLALLLADPFTGPFGVARTATVVLLAYAILRHQLLGLDVKVRWTLSKTTLAAAFIAVFFIVSEGAQQFFGETLGSSYVGILAAGALVFVIAPLSRVADRIAEKAVPLAAAPVQQAAARSTAADDAERAFRHALGLAMRGGRLGHEDEVKLAELAEALGIGAGRAVALLREAEREREVAG